MNRVTLLIAVVMYRCRREESQTLNSILPLPSTLRDSVRLLIINNSKEIEIPHSSDYEVRTEEENRGLAAPYNYALGVAKSEGIGWMLTLDQDTALTREYLEKAVETSKRVNERERGDVCAFVPILRNSEGHVSPGYYDVERGLYSSMKPIEGNKTLRGLKEKFIPFSFNSATLYSTEALARAGGFPTDYPLDMLDHAIFRKFYTIGLRMEILDEEHPLLHSLSAESREGMNRARAEAYLDKVERYYAEEEKLREIYQRLNPNADLTHLRGNYRRYLITMGIKRLILGLIGRRRGNPTAWMYFKRI